MEVFKYQATGNDFILTRFIPENPTTFSKAVCDRHFGIGADGILYPSASSVADIKMHYYNSDGTIAKMCGNGIRAFVRFLHDEKIITKPIFKVETLAGVLEVEVLESLISVNLGKPNLNVGNPDLRHTVKAGDVIPFDNYKGYVLSTGTLHTVVYELENHGMDQRIAGPIIQDNHLFTNQTNVNFVRLIDSHTLFVETFERGAGWTLSCGTGVAASVYHARLKDLIKTDVVDVKVLGGTLKVKLIDDEIHLIGPAKKVLEGVFHA